MKFRARAGRAKSSLRAVMVHSRKGGRQRASARREDCSRQMLPASRRPPAPRQPPARLPGIKADCGRSETLCVAMISLQSSKWYVADMKRKTGVVIVLRQGERLREKQS